MATAVLPSHTYTPPGGDCVICLAPNPTINEALFDCTHSAAFCSPCHYRAAIHLERCPVCRSDRKLVVPTKVHITDLVNTIDRAAPRVSYKFLADLSTILVNKVETMYSFRKSQPLPEPVESQDTPILHIPDMGGFIRPWNSSINVLETSFESVPQDEVEVTELQPVQAPLLYGWIVSRDTIFDTASRVYPALCDHPVLTVAPCNKPLRGHVGFQYPVDRRSLLLYVNWLNFTFMGDRDSGPLQNWMSANDMLTLTDCPDGTQSQKEWARLLVADQLDVLNCNAINVINAIRWRESTVVCPSPDRQGIYGFCDQLMNGGYLNIRHSPGPYCPERPTSPMADIDFGIPLSRSLEYISGPYAFVFDFRSLLDNMGMLYPDPLDSPRRGRICASKNVAISMMPDCYSLTQVMKHPSLGDTSLKVVRFFNNKKGLRRVVYRLACKGLLIATAMRVCGNIYPGNKRDKETDGVSLTKEKTASASNSNLNFEEAADDESSILLSSNVSMTDVEIVAANPDTYIYKVASINPVFDGNPSESDVVEYKRNQVSFQLALVKLWVPPQAKIAISPSDSKVRVSSAKVVAIVPVLKRVGQQNHVGQVYSMELAVKEMQNFNTNETVTYLYGAPIEKAYNFFHQPNSMQYVVGKTVVAGNFTNDLDAVCVPGIHGFSLQSEAVSYGVYMNSEKVDPDDIDIDSWATMDNKYVEKKLVKVD